MTDIERLRRIASYCRDEDVSVVMDAISEIERLRAALERIAQVLHPDDDFEHVETVGCAREIAFAALNIQKSSDNASSSRRS